MRAAKLFCFHFICTSFLPSTAFRRQFSASVGKFKWAPCNVHSVNGLPCHEVKIPFPEVNREITILEADETAQEDLIRLAVESSTNAAEEDPYGCVLWPAASSVCRRLFEMDVSNLTLLELGTGTGLVSLTAAVLGAKRVVASDYNNFSLELVRIAKTLQNCGTNLDNLETLIFDVKDLKLPLPPADLIVIADLLYDESLGNAVGHRIHEAIERGSKVIIADSPGRRGRPHMLNTLKRLQPGRDWAFKDVIGSTVCGQRDSIISTSATPVPLPMLMNIMEV